MKTTIRLLAALALAGAVYAYAIYDRAPKPASIPAELCRPVRMIPTRDGGQALGVVCVIPVPRSMEAPQRAPAPRHLF